LVECAWSLSEVRLAFASVLSLRPRPLFFTMANRPRIALVTYNKLPGLSPDDNVLRAALERAGATAEGVVWDDASVEWRSFDVVVVRSTWDYHLRLNEFRDWIDAREQDGSRVFNPPRILRWNTDKKYLSELQTRGVPVVPTRWVHRGSSSGLAELAAGAGWKDVVIKPTVSASAHGTWRASAPFDRESEQRFRDEVAARAVMLQPLVREVAEVGELSLMFIGGAFSHAVRKLPRAGDFRVQREHGGTATQVQPSEAMVKAAAHALAQSPAPTLYARVDGCEVNGRFLLMELELLEPSLFFVCVPEGAVRLSEAILVQNLQSPAPLPWAGPGNR